MFRQIRCLSRSSIRLNDSKKIVDQALKNAEGVQKSSEDVTDKPKSPPIINGLYYGQFTEKEYNEAAEFVRNKLKTLEDEIKGTKNVRENVGKMPQFPMRDPTGAQTVKNLTDLFIQTIKTTGPMSLSAYMRQCLTHPEFGYYTTRDPLDARTGDFITSPEISLMFGEMLGIWYFLTWQQQNRPSKIRFVEFGPGRGTLMHDMLKVFSKCLEKTQSQVNVEVVMIEASDVLRSEQRRLLCEDQSVIKEGDFPTSTTRWGFPIKWVDTEKDVKDSKGTANYVIAHEFFDALPVKQFEKTDDGWRELLVEYSQVKKELESENPKESAKSEPEPKLESEETPKSTFHLTRAPSSTPLSIVPTLNKRFTELPVGTRIEVSTDSELYVLRMAQLIDNQRGTGALMIMDYGVVGRVPDNTLRGIYKHKFVLPFEMPGKVDLSVDVDFDALSAICKKECTVAGPIDQGDWLHNMGIGYRVDQMIKKNEHRPEVQDQVYGAYRRLVDKDDKSMGKIYKFMAVVPSRSPPVAGF